MELDLARYLFKPDFTVGHLLVNGKSTCHILEDTDRGLSSTDSLAHIQQVKVPGKTAIPYGRYKVILAQSPRFKRLTPRLLGVPGFDGVLIHRGNKSADTEGCLLTGEYAETGADWITQSAADEALIMDILSRAEDRNEDIWITIRRA
jgi:hypothetical protein